jgi:hypothetical protein
LGLSNNPEFEPTQRVALWIRALFCLSICAFSVVASLVLLQNNREWALAFAVLTFFLFWYLEIVLRTQNFPLRPIADDRAQTTLAAGSIFLLTFIVSLPTLRTWFLTDDFALVHAFCHFSPSQFLQLLHMDLSQFIRGESRQEFRPLYSLFYVAVYPISGLHPWGYHLCQIFLHAIVALLVFLITKALAPADLRTAGFAAVLFIAQPLHGQATSLIVGAVAESLPAVLYLFAFLCFVLFRSTGRLLYMALSLAAFAALLLNKESAVTLPLMLASCDLLFFVMEEPLSVRRHWNFERWRRLLWPYGFYGILLLSYLAWRRRVFSSYLREANWAGHIRAEAANPVSLWTHFAHFASRVWSLQAFNFETFFPYSAVALGLVLGILMAWALSFFRQRNSTRSILLVLYFGVAWYLITNLPYLIEEQVTYHLYLPAAGMCIAVAILAVPIRSAPRHAITYSRLAGMTLLVILGLIQMWKADAEYRRFGDMSAQMSTQLAINLKNIPQNRWVMIWPGKSELIASGWGEEILPFSVQPPFAPSDLYSNLRVLEHPDMSCCGVGQWWQEISPELTAEFARPPDENITVDVLSWNNSAGTFQHESREMPRKAFVSRVVAILGAPPESMDGIDEGQGIRLVKSLADLGMNRSENPSLPVQSSQR